MRSLKRDINEENRSIQELKDMYRDLCLEKGLKDVLGIDVFVEANKRELVSYLNNQEYEFPDRPEFAVIRVLYTVPDYRKRIERLVLGSLISSYADLEIETGLKRKILLLDTNFIVSLFDLHSTESFETCTEVLSMAKKFGFPVEVLPETILETKNLLKKKATSIARVPLFAAQDRNSIEYGCHRRRLSRSDLYLYESKVEYLLRQAGVNIIEQSENSGLKRRALTSDIYTKIKDRQFNREGALHDAMAQEYVRAHRGADESDFISISAFFVTDSRGFLENKTSFGSQLPYIIRAEELLNILWLLNPTSTSNITTLNLSRVFSIFLEKKLPDREMLSRLDHKIRSISGLPVNADDCREIVVNLSVIDSEQLQELLDVEEDVALRAKIADMAISAQEKGQKEREEYETSVSRVVDMMKSKQQKELEALSRTTHDLGSQLSDLEKQRTEMSRTNAIEQLRLRKEALTTLLDRDKEELSLLLSDKEKISADIDRRKSLWVGAIISVVAAIIAFCCIKFIIPKWNTLELITYAIGLLVSIALGFLSLVEKSIPKKRLFNAIVGILLKSRIQKELDLVLRISKLQSRLDLTEKELNSILL